MSGDDVNLGVNVNPNWGNIIDNSGVFAPGTTRIRDTTSVSHTGTETPPYSPTGQPQLPPPSAYATVADIDVIANLVKSYPQNILAAADMLPAPDTKFLDETEADLEKLTDEQIANMGAGLPKDQVIKMVRFSIFHPNAKMPGDIAEAAAEIREKVVATTGQQPSPLIAAISDKMENYSFTSVLKAELLKSGLTPDQQQQLLAAHDMPQFAAKLSPEMRAILNNAEKAAFATVQQEFGIPNNWTIPSDAQGYKLGVSMAFDTKVGDMLYDKLCNGDISRADYNALRTMFYMTGSSPPNAADLRPLLNEIIGQAKGEVQTEWGFPDGYNPEMNPQQYESILTGAYYYMANKAIANRTPPLSAADQALLQSALSSPQARENLPPILKRILDVIEGETIRKVQSQYGLPDDWTPNVEMLANAKSLAPNVKFAQSALSMGLEYFSHLKGLTKTSSNAAVGNGDGGDDGVPPLLNKLLNYLKSVSVALIGLQEVLYSSSVLSSDLAKMLNRIQNDATIGKLAKKKAELEEVKAKEAKAASMGPFKWIMMIIIMIILFLVLGPMAIVLVTAMFINTMVRSKGDINKMDLIGDVLKTVGDIGTAIGGKAFGGALEVLFAVLCFFVNPIAAVTLFLVDLLVGNASIVKNLLTAVGVPDDIATYITMAVQVVAMIVSAGLTLLLAIPTGGGSVAAFAATVSAFASNLTSKIAMMVIRVVMQVLQTIMKFLQKVPMLKDVVKFIQKTIEKLTKLVEKYATKITKAEENLEKVMDKLQKAENKLSNASSKLKSLENGLKNAKNELKLAEKGSLQEEELLDKIGTLQRGVNEAKGEFKLAEKEFEAVAEEVSTEADKQLRGLMEVKEFLETSVEVAQAAVQVNNDILQAQIALIKGHYNAYEVVVEEFVNILKALVAKFLQTLQDIGKTLAGLAQSYQQMYHKLSDTSSAAAAAFVA